jgi:hypothetical protein
VPDAAGTFKGISLGGRAAEAWDRIFGDGTHREPRRHRGTVGELMDAWDERPVDCIHEWNIEHCSFGCADD